MGLAGHLYMRGVVTSAKHHQHIATNGVQARGISFETSLPVPLRNFLQARRSFAC